MDADGSDVQRLTEHAGFDVLPVWSPDGAWIAFASDRGESPAAGASIFIMRTDGSQVRRLVRAGADSGYPTSWTR